ncbi:hypothetical protein DL98DRAFT_122528 [Cadophora sp. DSE1049]|nr:hypothetical protein DL98DRAFT_122528 [Cadophora sp. DSE1049]
MHSSPSKTHLPAPTRHQAIINTVPSPRDKPKRAPPTEQLHTQHTTSQSLLRATPRPRRKSHTTQCLHPTAQRVARKITPAPAILAVAAPASKTPNLLSKAAIYCPRVTRGYGLGGNETDGMRWMGRDGRLI